MCPAPIGLVKKLGFVLAPARTRLTPPAEAAASQKWKIIYLQVLRLMPNWGGVAQRLIGVNVGRS